MVRVKGKKTDGKLEGTSRVWTLQKPRRGPKKKRSPFSQEPSSITLNVEKICVRCDTLIFAFEPCWHYPKLSGYVHTKCSKKGGKKMVITTKELENIPDRDAKKPEPFNPDKQEEA